MAVELRTVNHRFFNPSLKLPSAVALWESEIRELLRTSIARGHVTLVARVEREGTAVQVDEHRFEAYVRQLRELQQRYGMADTLDVGTVLRLPEVMAAGEEPAPGTVDELLAVVREALAALMRMRESEGTRLAELLRDRIALVAGHVERIAARAPARLVSERERLRRSVRELADGVDLDDGRLAQEIALLADRLDVSEEVDRFRAHLDAFRETLEPRAAEPVGKRLGFLLQEMLRETNTTGSKARDAAMLHEVVAVKEELERIAEQVENLE